MTVGMVASEANEDLDALVAEFPWIKLHVGDPGAAGTSNAAGNTTRKQASWSAASGGSVTTSAELLWSDAEVNTAEDYTHISGWTASTAGSFGWSGTMTANAVSASGDEFRIAAGGITLSLTVAA